MIVRHPATVVALRVSPQVSAPLPPSVPCREVPGLGVGAGWGLWARCWGLAKEVGHSPCFKCPKQEMWVTWVGQRGAQTVKKQGVWKGDIVVTGEGKGKHWTGMQLPLASGLLVAALPPLCLCGMKGPCTCQLVLKHAIEPLLAADWERGPHSVARDPLCSPVESCVGSVPALHSPTS